VEDFHLHLGDAKTKILSCILRSPGPDARNKFGRFDAVAVHDAEQVYSCWRPAA